VSQKIRKQWTLRHKCTKLCNSRCDETIRTVCTVEKFLP